MSAPHTARSDVAPPPQVAALIARASHQYETGQTQAAWASFDDAVAADPTPAARIALASTLASTQPRRAIAELERAWDHARRLNSPAFRALCCNHLAVLHLQQGSTALAAGYRQHALTAQMELADDNPGAPLPSQVLIDLAALWASSPEDEAWSESLLNAAAPAADTFEQAMIASHRGVIATRTGRWEEALVHWSQAQRQFCEAGQREGAAHTMINLGHLLLQQQRLVLARRAYQIARDLFLEEQQSQPAAAAECFAREAGAWARLAAGTADWN